MVIFSFYYPDASLSVSFNCVNHILSDRPSSVHSESVWRIEVPLEAKFNHLGRQRPRPSVYPGPGLRGIVTLN